ncbi:MAG: 2,4-dihydroxyhept-2-ene-1,7-dioic acid aldolase [Magnetococcales bacterium]|nr:2,4-dihydroxyhept-2-ene-1,7-dioic acid aldolase [Magnetococcales bacterium]MBF0157217.1 2,4-dihydroxyhept-2-ene-1,7-dioic acid aldolase [Magnetococcales bacterium]
MPCNARLKEGLRSGRVMVGSWITLAHPAIAEIMARAGFHWLAVDLEHSVITIREAEELIRVIDLCGASPLVRLTSNDPNLIKRVMDAGAHGIIVPMVKSRADADAAVRAVRYPTEGNRGVGLARAQGYGAAFGDYRQWLEEGAVVIVQIEHIDAVDTIGPILSHPGVDGYILGPYDLSGSMGLVAQFAHPDFLAAMARVRDCGKALNKPGGLHIIEPDPPALKARIDEGFRFLAYSLDIRMLDASCRAGLTTLENLS